VTAFTEDADGVYSKVREQLMPGSAAHAHAGHHAWRGVLPTRDEPVSEDGWNEALFDLIEATPDEAILHNQIMFVPELPRWTSDRVVLIGDAAHGLSPHIAAGGTLGVEGVGVLTRKLEGGLDIAGALKAYEADRMARYEIVREHSRAVEGSADAREYAETYAAFSHWMLTERPKIG
jgi:2-polyprenyl-6-methoxyphenol hydroxylase-like FAD-dependent oxidoreductase